MHRVHVPDVLKTGCFTRCTMAKAIEPSGEEVTYVLRYDAPSLAAYERYRDDFAPAIQKEHTDRYAGHFRGARLILEEVGSFVAPGN